MAWCNVSSSAQIFIASLNVPPAVVIAIILLILLLLGCIIDNLPLILIGVPIVHPVAVSLGFDPIWFAMMALIIICLGTFTPPVGISLFVFKGLDMKMPMGTIYKGAMPFVFATLVAVFIMFFVPSIITWLPNVLK
jgi:TRAP-type C4-dicarboxylate transport system permease large subunit